MSLFFTNMVLWPLLALASVPLALHLFARAKPPVYRFSSIEFILRIVRSTIRIKKPKDRLLLLIRTLLFTALILTFMLPVLFGKAGRTNPFDKRNVVVIIDATASMNYVEGAQTRFAAACAEASAILSGLSSRDTANIVMLHSSPDPVFPEMGFNLSHLQETLRRARGTVEAGDVAEAMRIAIEQLAGTEGEKEIFIISDFQRTAWENINIVETPEISISTVKVGKEEGANRAVADIYWHPAQPLTGEDISFYCEIRNYSSTPGMCAVFLKIGESRQSLNLMLPAWSRETAIFRHKFNEPGEFTVTASITEDAFSGDDTRWATLTVRDQLKSAIAEPINSTGEIWLRALDAIEWTSPEIIPAGALEGELPFDIIMIPEWNGAALENLKTKRNEGCMIICMPAPGTPVSALLSLAGVEEQASSEDTMNQERSDQGFRLMITDKTDKAFKLFATGEYGDPSRGVFHSRLKFNAAALRAGTTIMSFEDNLPALVDFPGKNRLLLWNMPLGPESADWQAQVEFLPFLAELILSGRPASADGPSMDFLTGERPFWRPRHEVMPGDAALVKEESGAEVPILEHRTHNGAVFTATDPPEPGLYAWRYKGKTVQYSAVNFPVIESDLRTMPTDELKKAGIQVFAGAGEILRLRGGIRLFPYLLALCVALILLESVIVLRDETK